MQHIEKSSFNLEDSSLSMWVILFTSTRFPCPTNTYTRNLCTDPLHQPGITKVKQALPLAVFFISKLLVGMRQNWASSSGSAAENPPANAGDTGSIPGLRRSPGGGNGKQLQYPCLGNAMDCGPPGSSVRGIAESNVT